MIEKLQRILYENDDSETRQWHWQWCQRQTMLWHAQYCQFVPYKLFTFKKEHHRKLHSTPIRRQANVLFQTHFTACVNVYVWMGCIHKPKILRIHKYSHWYAHRCLLVVALQKVKTFSGDYFLHNTNELNIALSVYSDEYVVPHQEIVFPFIQ